MMENLDDVWRLFRDADTCDSKVKGPSSSSEKPELFRFESSISPSGDICVQKVPILSPSDSSSEKSGFKGTGVVAKTILESRRDSAGRPLLVKLADDIGSQSVRHADGMSTPFNRGMINNIIEFTSLSLPTPRKPRKRRILNYPHSYKLKSTGDMNLESRVKLEPDIPHVHGHSSPISLHKRGKKGAYGPMTTARRKILYRKSDMIDLSVVIGLPQSECTPECMESRRPTIRHKVLHSQLSFTLLEEYDIHMRAEHYIRSIRPDRDFCVPKGKAHMDSFEDCSIVQVLSDVSCNQYGKSDDEDDEDEFACSHIGIERKRRRHSCGDVDCFVVQPTAAQLRIDNSGEGLCLLRPPNKLVELVAQAINESPDGMLQVQQVYIALQNRFPYFQYMDKASTTSWRSSIRHALYQKWFRKIAFSTEVINSKGCYWAINRRYQPREWTLPPTKEEPIEEELVKEEDFPELGIVSFPDGQRPSTNFSPFAYYTSGHDYVADEPLDLRSSATIAESACSSGICHSRDTFLPRPRDPDPMLSPSEDFQAISSQDIELSSDSSNDSCPISMSSDKSGSLDGVTFSDVRSHDEDYLPVIVYEAPTSLSTDEADYLGSLEWISSVDNCPTSPLGAGSFALPEQPDYQTPLITPYCVSYTAAPPIGLTDSDLADPDTSVYIAPLQSYPEQW